MMDPTSIITIAAASLTGLAIVTLATLSGWRGWLDLQRQRLAGPRPGGGEPGPATARIELADLKERIRKLEAIAAGIDL
ncbi:MAG: hypothetical protein JOY99_17925 [Sphingomonadaceae bacterium]|nr:hypothetical protein [Sphingomonadaceae bacterium]